MNIDQRNQIIEFIKNYDTQKLLDAIRLNYPIEKEWDNQIVDIYTVTNYLQLIPRIFNQILEATKNEDFIVYPWEYSHPIIGTNNIGNHLSHLNNCIDEKHPLTEYHQSVTWMVKYLLDNNLWNKERPFSSIVDLEEKETILVRVSEKINSSLKLLEESKLDWEKEKAIIEEERKALSNFVEMKKDELRLISEALSTVTIQKNEIDNINKNVIKVDSELTSIQKNQKEQVNSLKEQMENQSSDFKLLVYRIEDNEKKLNSIIIDGEEKIKYFKTLEQFILEKQKEIIELGALAAGAALGGTFGLREKKLEKGVDFWKYAVPAITILSMIWVFVVFTCLKPTTDVIWVNVVLSVAKTIPAFVLMGFVFKQYSKERNLQEEYAFKAAVSNTIKAYADLVRNEDTQDNKTKQQLLSDAVKQVQTPPKLYTENSEKIFSFSTSGLSNTLKNLNETIKNIKGVN